MLSLIETGLIEAVKALPIGEIFKTVDALPDTSGDVLVKKIATQAPAVYVVLEPFNVDGLELNLVMSVAVVVRNARDVNAPRRGDKVTVGLYECVVNLLLGLQSINAGGVIFNPVRVSWPKEELLTSNGLALAEITLAGKALLSDDALMDTLADFKTLHAQYDLTPHANSAEHENWLEEPPNHSNSTPDLQQTVTLQE